ncbi:MAG: hypothetical protein P8020_12250, partial [Acidobacteriota bacterium]
GTPPALILSQDQTLSFFQTKSSPQARVPPSFSIRLSKISACKPADQRSPFPNREVLIIRILDALFKSSMERIYHAYNQQLKIDLQSFD